MDVRYQHLCPYYKVYLHFLIDLRPKNTLRKRFECRGLIQTCPAFQVVRGNFLEAWSNFLEACGNFLEACSDFLEARGNFLKSYSDFLEAWGNFLEALQLTARGSQG